MCSNCLTNYWAHILRGSSSAGCVELTLTEFFTQLAELLPLYARCSQGSATSSNEHDYLMDFEGCLGEICLLDNLKNVYRTNSHTEAVKGKHTKRNLEVPLKNFVGWISTYLKGVQCACVCRDKIFITSYKINLTLLFFGGNTWFVWGKSCAWRWILLFLPAFGKWQLRSSLSVNAMYC
jgi:hypothetical protein